MSMNSREILKTPEYSNCYEIFKTTEYSDNSEIKKNTDYSDCAEGSEGPKVPEVPNDLKVLVVDYSKMQHKIIVVSELLLIFASSNL